MAERSVQHMGNCATGAKSQIVSKTWADQRKEYIMWNTKRSQVGKVPVLFNNLVGLKALTIVLSYRNYIVMEVQHLVYI